MARFVKDGDVFAIEQEDKELAITERGKTVRRRFITGEHAAKQLAKIVGDKLASGYTETADAPRRPPEKSREDELCEAIIACPEDDAAYVVLADHLVEKDDRRGELISLMLADERDAKLRSKIERYLGKHAPRMLGPLAKRLDDASELDGPIAWRRGFVDGLTMHRKRTHGDLAELLDEMLAQPALRLVRRIVLRAGRDDLRQPCAVLAQRAPVLLQDLELHGRVPSLDGIARALPSLKRLVVVPRSASPEFDEPSPAIRSLATAPFQALERLEVASHDPGELSGLFARKDLPLRELCLRVEQTDDYVMALADAPLAAQLEVLDLGHGWHRDDDVRRLVVRRDCFPSLREVVLVPADDRVEVERLRELFRVVMPKHRSFQNDDDLDDEDDERYDDIDE